MVSPSGATATLAGNHPVGIWPSILCELRSITPRHWCQTRLHKVVADRVKWPNRTGWSRGCRGADRGWGQCAAPPPPAGPGRWQRYCRCHRFDIYKLIGSYYRVGHRTANSRNALIILTDQYTGLNLCLQGWCACNIKAPHRKCPGALGVAETVEVDRIVMYPSRISFDPYADTGICSSLFLQVFFVRAVEVDLYSNIPMLAT